MSTLVWQPSPRSSASPQPHAMSGPARHQVGFGHNSHAFVAQHASSSGGSGTGGPSGFGFGFGAPSPSASTSTSSNGFGFGGGLRSPSSSSSYTSMPFPGSSQAAASSSQRGMTLTGSATPANNRRRRRSDSAEEMREDTEETSMTTESAAAGKRARREIRPVKSLANLHYHQSQQASSAGSSTGLGAATNTGVPPSPQNEVDIGKALAGLSKPALLTVLTSLLSQQPGLKPLVLSLLPPPSLDTFTSTLNSLERRILDALPSGGATRQEYVWSRIRAPLEEYISEARLALSQFCPSSSTLAAQGVNDDQQQQQQQQSHPTSTFAFLYTLTLSVRKLEAVLPRAPVPFSTPTSATSSGASINNPSTLNQRDPLISFLPPLYNQWHHLITKLSTSVNQGGKILSAEMLRGWFRNLDTLVSVESVAAMAIANSAASSSAVAIADAGSVGRRASEAVRDRFVKELGWLVGIRQTVAPFQTAALLSPLRSGSTQVMDSRMMGDNGEDTDEEL